MIIQLKNVNANEVKKLEALLGDEAFVATLNELGTVEDVQSAFAAKGADFTAEEICEIRDAIAAAMVAEGADELTAESLENVAGGVFNVFINYNKKTGLTINVTVW